MRIFPLIPEGHLVAERSRLEGFLFFEISPCDLFSCSLMVLYKCYLLHFVFVIKIRELRGMLCFYNINCEFQELEQVL